MNAWLQGDSKREFFSVMAPPSTAWSSNLLPDAIARAPLPTLVIRQRGEAWSHPFTAVFEATADGASAQVEGVEEIVAAHGVALRVKTAGARRQTIISNDSERGVYAQQGQRLTGRYGIVAERGDGLDFLFLGHGKELAAMGYALTARGDGASAAVWREEGAWFYTASEPVQLRVPAALWPGQLELQGRRVRGRTEGTNRIFELPAMAATRLVRP
jgi:hypothetical protein